MEFISRPYGAAYCGHANCRRFAKVHGLCLQHGRIIVRPLPQSNTSTTRLIPSPISISSADKRRNHNRRCRHDNCKSYARGGGYCTRHGGGRKCRVGGCTTASQTGGFCRQHGGGSKCREPTCSLFARVGGRCLQHQVHGSSTSSSKSQDDDWLDTSQ